MSVLPHGGWGGWVWQNFRVGGCPTPPPPGCKQNTEQCGYDHAPVTRGRMRAQFPLPHGPPGVGWDFVGALGSIEPVPLLSFFYCRFHVTCLFMVCLHGIAYHVCMPHAHKGARMHCHLCKCEGGNAKTPQLLCVPHAHKGVRGWVGGWVGVRPPPPSGGGGAFVGLWVCQNSGWVGGSLN